MRNFTSYSNSAGSKQGNFPSSGQSYLKLTAKCKGGAGTWQSWALKWGVKLLKMFCGNSWAPLRKWPHLSVPWGETPEMLRTLSKDQEKKSRFFSRPEVPNHWVLDLTKPLLHWWELGGDTALSHSLKVSSITIPAVQFTFNQQMSSSSSPGRKRLLSVRSAG